MDLSKATDRFPIDLIALVLEGRFPKTFVDSWRDIMVGYAFHSAAGEVRYEVGNPMGAYSSWASFALAHHYVMYRIAQELRRPWSSLPYVVLGDDILIGDEDIGARYLELVSVIGVEVSLQKSYISDEICEFAKRVILTTEMTEISPFPVHAVVEEGSVSLLVSTIAGAERKGYVPLRGIPEAVTGLKEVLTGPRSPNPAKRERERLRAYLCEVSTKFLSGLLTSGEFFAAVCGPAGRNYSPGEVDHFLRVVMADILAQSLVTGPDSFAALSDR